MQTPPLHKPYDCQILRSTLSKTVWISLEYQQYYSLTENKHVLPIRLYFFQHPVKQFHIQVNLRPWSKSLEERFLIYGNSSLHGETGEFLCAHSSEVVKGQCAETSNGSCCWSVALNTVTILHKQKLDKEMKPLHSNDFPENKHGTWKSPISKQK